MKDLLNYLLSTPTTAKLSFLICSSAISCAVSVTYATIMLCNKTCPNSVAKTTTVHYHSCVYRLEGQFWWFSLGVAGFGWADYGRWVAELGTGGSSWASGGMNLLYPTDRPVLVCSSPSRLGKACLHGQGGVLRKSRNIQGFLRP